MIPRFSLAACVAAVAGACCLGVPAVATAATVTVGGPAPVAPTSTAQGFVGIASSFSTIPGLAGPPAHPDTPFIQLLKNLSPDAPFVLRLGGNTADNSWWPVRGVKQPRHLYKLTPRWAAHVRGLLSALGGKAIIGVNLDLSPNVDARVAKAEVGAFDRYVGAKLIDAFELGNEPEFFPLSIVDGGEGNDTIPAYAEKFSSVASKLGRAPLAGPSSVGPAFLDSLSALLSDLPPRLKLVTVHAYALKHCSPGAEVSTGDFFTGASIQGLADSVHGMVEAAAAHHKPLRVDEINGITCGGAAGVSNSFGEALWALNVLPALWQAGVQGVNFQSIYGDFNQLIHAKHSRSGWSVSVEPEYYGLLAFAQAAPAGSRLLEISNPGIAGLYEFAVRAPDGSERVVLTNVGAAAQTVAVSAPGAHADGSVALLRAPSLGATGGTTLAGQRLSPRSGQLAGSQKLTTVKPGAGGVYQVAVPAGSAAILTLPS